MPLSRFSSVEISLSYRLHPHGRSCCYVYAYLVTDGDERSLLGSKHFTASPERLVDQVDAYVRELQLEHYLTRVDPF
jgi:hypothetical protein